MTRVLHIIGSVDPRSGGPVEGLRVSGLEREANGDQLEVLSLDRSTEPFVADFPLRTHGVGPVTGAYGYARAFGPWVARNIKNFDVAVIHGLWNYSSVGAYRYLRSSRTPYYVFAHGMLDPYFKQAHPVKHWFKQAIWSAIQGRVLRDAEAVLFTSEEEMQLAQGSFLGHRFRGLNVGYGVAEPPADEEAQRQAFQAKLPDLRGKPYLLYLSRIHPKKGCDLLISAFAATAAKHPDLQLVMAGPDQIGWQATLQSLARESGVADRVHWPGMLTGAVKWGAFRSADAFVLPSHQENFGIVVAEAMACGTPVLITQKVNIWREVEKSGAGLVADADTLEGTTRLLEKWLSLAPAEAAAIRRQARSGYLRFFDVRQTAAEMASVLRV